jgi:hypothetical protein
MALVSPGEGYDFGTMARALLELADDPADVKSTSDTPTGLGFDIPDYLHERWLELLTSGDTASPAKRGPGRPRRAATEAVDG